MTELWPAIDSIWDSKEDLLLACQLSALAVGFGSEMKFNSKNGARNHYVVCNPVRDRTTLCSGTIVAAVPVDDTNFCGAWRVIPKSKVESDLRLERHSKHNRRSNTLILKPDKLLVLNVGTIISDMTSFNRLEYALRVAQRKIGKLLKISSCVARSTGYVGFHFFCSFGKTREGCDFFIRFVVLDGGTSWTVTEVCQNHTCKQTMCVPGSGFLARFTRSPMIKLENGLVGKQYYAPKYTPIPPEDKRTRGAMQLSSSKPRVRYVDENAPTTTNVSIESSLHVKNYTSSSDEEDEEPEIPTASTSKLPYAVPKVKKIKWKTNKLSTSQSSTDLQEAIENSRIDVDEESSSEDEGSSNDSEAVERDNEGVTLSAQDEESSDEGEEESGSERGNRNRSLMMREGMNSSSIELDRDEMAMDSVEESEIYEGAEGSGSVENLTNNQMQILDDSESATEEEMEQDYTVDQIRLQNSLAPQQPSSSTPQTKSRERKRSSSSPSTSTLKLTKKNKQPNDIPDNSKRLLSPPSPDPSSLNSKQLTLYRRDKIRLKDYLLSSCSSSTYDTELLANKSLHKLLLKHEVGKKELSRGWNGREGRDLMWRVLREIGITTSVSMGLERICSDGKEIEEIDSQYEPVDEDFLESLADIDLKTFFRQITQGNIHDYHKLTRSYRTSQTCPLITLESHEIAPLDLVKYWISFGQIKLGAVLKEIGISLGVRLVLTRNLDEYCRGVNF